MRRFLPWLKKMDRYPICNLEIASSLSAMDISSFHEIARNKTKKGFCTTYHLH